MSGREKPTICLDFDGVVHAYRKGWQGGEIYDDVTEGFFEWASKAQTAFKLVIHSSRFAGEEGPAQLAAAMAWLRAQHATWLRGVLQADPLADLGVALPAIQFSAEKPPAWLSIDDRCVRFDGDWGAEALGRGKMLGYRPWTAKKVGAS